MASTPENRLDRIAQSSDMLRAKSEALVAQSGERMESAKRLLTSPRRTAEGVPVASDGAPLHEGLRGSGPDELAALVRLQGIGARFVRDGDITLLPAGAVDPRTLRLVDLFARQAADLIVHSRVCRAHPR